MRDYSKIESVSEIDQLIAKSQETPVLLFKHSLTCPISTAAFKQYEQVLQSRPEDDGAVYTLVEIQKARDVSTEIASRTGVRHESPQALVLRDGEVTWHASHWSIQAADLATAVDGG